MAIELSMLKMEGCGNMKLNKLCLITAIIFLIIITGCNSKKQESATMEVDLSQETKEIEAFGLVKAEETKYITIDFAAEILEVLVKEGQHVNYNDPILKLDLSQYESQLSEMKSKLNIASLEQEGIIKNLDNLGNFNTEVKKLRNELDFSTKLYNQSVEDFNSNEKLYNEGAISKELFEQSKLNMEEAKNNLEKIQYELQQAIESNEKELESEGELSAIQAERVLQLENSLADLENKLNRTYIKGNQIVSEYENAAIYNISYTSGDKADPAKKAFGIANLDKLIVEADVVEEFIKDVRIGASVRIVPVADRTREYEGKVIFISQMAFAKNGETIVPIRISMDNTDSFILPNYNVDVFIDATDKE